MLRTGTIIVLSAFATATAVSGQTISWGQQFGTAGTDIISGMVTNGLAVYVTGYTEGAIGGANMGGRDAFVRKYDLRGRILWTRQFGTGADEMAIAVAAGFTAVYVAGYTSSSYGTRMDAFLRKYSTNGNLIWTREFATVGKDVAWGVALDATGVYFAGDSNVSIDGVPPWGFFLQKFDFEGNLQWTRQFGSPGSGKVNALAADFTGIYVAGWTSELLGSAVSGGADAFVRKYDIFGNILWTSQFGTPGFDAVFGISASIFGVYLGGATTGSLSGANAGGYDAFVRKCDISGNVHWTRQFGTGGVDQVMAITEDVTGVYVAGNTTGSLGGANAGNFDAFVRRYDIFGNAHWTRQFGGPGFEFEWGCGIAATWGRIYVGGDTRSSLFGANSGGDDAFLAHIAQ